MTYKKICKPVAITVFNRELINEKSVINIETRNSCHGTEDVILTFESFGHADALLELAKRVQSEINLLIAVGATINLPVAHACNKSCSPSDFYKGGKCDINGCFY